MEINELVLPFMCAELTPKQYYEIVYRLGIRVRKFEDIEDKSEFLELWAKIEFLRNK